MRVDVVARAVQPYVVEDVERAAASVPDRILDGGLEAVTRVHDERRIVDPRHVARAQLDVVRLLARPRQIDDLDAGTGDVARCVGERIERRDDRLGTAGGTRPAATRDEERCHADHAQENGSRKHAPGEASRE
jgi:hypothetical protein